MTPENATTTAREAERAAQRVFTVETANSALVLVRKIVRDVVDRYAELMRVRAECHELAAAITPTDRLEALRERIAQSVGTLNRLSGELREIGCELKDWADGLVDFPALRQGHKVWLCWRLDEAEITHWHEYDAGFAGRRPIDDRFG